MKRKTIALCVTGYDWEYETRVVFGVYERCKEKNINLLVFANLMRKPELNSGRVLPESIIQGEMEIFNLINHDLIDGIIVIGDSITEENTLLRIVDRANQHNIPIIDINDPTHTELCRNIVLSDKYAMEYVMRHLVEDHGITKINFIGGFRGNVQTEERLEAYKKVLGEHDIPIEETRIGYGEFWLKAKEVTADFIKSGDLPQAIVCANDTMAIFCMDTLKNHGYRIPEDIIVTGFDATPDCWKYSPTLTTVRRAFYESGVKAADMLTELWEGKEVPMHNSVESVLVKNQSCGCGADVNNDKINDFYGDIYGAQQKFNEFMTYHTAMNTAFASADTSAEMYESLKQGAEFFGLAELYVCIGSEIENGSRRYNEDEILPIGTGISKTMVSMLEYGHSIPCGYEFPSAQLLPMSFLEGDEPTFYAFSPLYFKNRFLGYMAYKPSRFEGSGDMFQTWLMSISNNAGSFYMNNELEFVVDELENLYIRDPLTGLYNRRGMKRLGYKAIETAMEAGEWVTIMCADIDNLKPINDIYGHEAGDNAIMRVAKAIEASVPKDSICTRTGGDEYCIIIPDSDSETAKEYVRKIDEYLDEYNSGSELPYKVGCSCGSYSIGSDRLLSLDQMINAADEDMYKVKQAKKAVRD